MLLWLFFLAVVGVTVWLLLSDKRPYSPMDEKDNGLW